MRKLPLLTIILTALLVTGCAGSALTPPTDNAAGQATAALSEPGDLSEDDGDVALVQNPSDFPDCRPLIEGSVRFEKDTAREASVEFLADGTEKTLSLDDGNGLTWELIIPADALDHPETITMTSMKNISSALGTIFGGIVLQPDGIRFLAPVTLRVKGNGIETSGLPFSGNGKGEELELPILHQGEDAVEMKIFHFSTAFITADAKAIDAVVETAQGQINNLSALAKQLFQRPIEVPVPPAIPLKCHHDTEDQDDKKIAKYAEDFGKPETDLIVALLAAKTTMERETGESPEFSLELRLVRRL